MKKLLTTACLFVVTTVAIVSFIAPTVFGQEQKTAKANSSPAKSVTVRVDKLFAQWDKPDSPGCALGIVKDGRLIYKRGYGMANLDHNVPITSETVLDVMSMSKQFTATSILLLARQGRLSLDDDIRKYLPELPRYQSTVTIRHLIHHTSGIREMLQMASLAAGMWTEGVELSNNEYLALITRQKALSFKPGDEYLYTNSEYLLLDLIVERASGKPFREFVTENIFKPLGMSKTHIQTDRTLVIRNRATGHHPHSSGGFSDSKTKSGEIDTTVEDLFLWDQNFYNNKLGGGPDLISEQLSTGTLNNGEKLNYAFGLIVGDYKGLKRIGHGGSGGGFTSNMFRYPEQYFSVICLCNASGIPAGSLANQVADIFLADQFKKNVSAVSETTAAAPVIVSEKDLASLTGLYVDPVTSSNHSYYMKDGKLMIFNSVLSPLGQDRFKVVGGGPPGLEIAFTRPAAGGSMQVKHMIGVRTTTYYARQIVAPTTAQLAEFIGKFVSDDLAGAIYTVSVKDGKLNIQGFNGINPISGGEKVLTFSQSIGKQPSEKFVLTPVFADSFLHPGGDSFIIKFTRNEKTAISGFTLSVSLVRGLRFTKQ